MERCNAGLSFWIVRSSVHKHADPPHAFGLLRARRNGPCCRAAEQGYEAAPFQSTKFRQVAAIRKGRSILEDGDQVRSCAVQDFGRPTVRSGSTPEVTV